MNRISLAPAWTGDAFDGAKLILFIGAEIAVLRRDDLPGLAYANCLDLPGGQREAAESPEACVLRELDEELGLRLAPSVLVWRRLYHLPVRAWFFAAHLPEAAQRDIRFGGEGQGWSMMRPVDFVASDEAVPHFRARVQDYLSAHRLDAKT